MKHALVVDDSRTMRSMLTKWLTGLGYDVIQAENGQHALDLLAAQGPVNLILVDWNMPIMDGYDMLRAVRADRSHALTTIVMVSAENDSKRIARALMAGADEYVMKPLTRDILLDKLALVGETL